MFYVFYLVLYIPMSRGSGHKMDVRFSNIEIVSQILFTKRQHNEVLT